MSIYGEEKANEVLNTLQKSIRIGTVSSINPKDHTARIVFEDEGHNVSYDLPIIVPNSYDNSDYRMPDINEDVLCLFLPDGIEDGFILGSWYAGEIKPPCDNPEIRRVKFKDGTTISYNRATHELDVVIEGTHIHADRQKVNVTTPQEVNINTTNANITASGNITMQSVGDTAITAGGNLTLQGANISLN